MEIINVYKSPRVVEAIRVSVMGVDGHSDREVFDFAMKAAHETRESLFGWSIMRTGNMAGVTLNRD